MVELAKSANGPVKLGLYIVAGGVLVGGAAVAVVGPAAKKGAGIALNAAKQKFAPSKAVRPAVFTVSADADGGKGLRLHVGDTFIVTNEIEGGALIEIRGYKKNPWMVSSHVLEKVSGFRSGDSEL
jgi:hypothetical protein